MIQVWFHTPEDGMVTLNMAVVPDIGDKVRIRALENKFYKVTRKDWFIDGDWSYVDITVEPCPLPPA